MTFERAKSFSLLFLCAVAACAEDSTGVSADIEVVHHFQQDAQGEIPGPFADAVVRSFVTDMGYTIELEQAYLTLQSVSLQTCTNTTETSWYRWLSPIGTAHAHSATTPTELGAPLVESLLRSDLTTRTWGTIEPPPGSYCQLALEIGPADSDALHLPTDADMVGVTLHLSGTYQSGSSAPQPFTIRSSSSVSVDIELHDEDGRPTEVLLSADAPGASLVVGMTYDQWLDGIDFAQADPTTWAAQALQTAAAALHHHAGSVVGHGSHEHDATSAHH